MNNTVRLAVLGAGNIGTAIVNGLLKSGSVSPDRMTLTRRKTRQLDAFEQLGCVVGSDNAAAVNASDIVVLAVEPQQIDALLDEIGPVLDADRHIIISVVSGVSSEQIRGRLGTAADIVRAMPNTAIAILESMTCLASTAPNGRGLAAAKEIFDTVGTTLVIDEDQMTAATALGACGTAFFLRAIRAASQGGVEIGFHSKDAIAIAAHTARGAASLLLDRNEHPEHEIDNVATPRGCTISGLNQMEHAGFSSAMIKGIVTSAEKAARLYSKDE